MSQDLEATNRQDMTIHCEGFSLPESALLSKESLRVLQQQVTDQKAAAAIASKEPISDTPPTREDVREQFYQSERYKKTACPLCRRCRR